MVESIFFAKEGEKGVNETSAAHLCALASGVKEEAESFLNSISFINEFITIVGSSSKELPTSVGTTDLDKITKSLVICSDMNAFISWYAEARKELEACKKALNSLSLEQWAAANNIKLPEMPENEQDYHNFTFQDAVARLSIKDRETYLRLEASSATLGKFIHKNCPMDEAREDLHRYLSQPYESRGVGRDTVIHHYVPSVENEKIEDLYMLLQKKYRSTEQQLNHMKADLRKVVDYENSVISAEKRNKYSAYKDALVQYNVEMGEYRLQFEKYLEDERIALSKVKFSIPKALEGTMEYLNNLGAL